MWQLYALGSLLTNSLGSVVDKNALVHDRAIDSAVATLWRLVLYVVCVTAVGITGVLWTKPAQMYIPRVAFSKMCDALTTLLWAQALLFAAVSQVSAIGALQPFVVFILTIIGQRIFGLRIGEKLGLPRMEWKAMTISLLIVGGLLVG